MSWQVHTGDCLEVLPTLEPESVQTVVTSPPYWGLRDYGTATWEGGDSECDHRIGGQVPQTRAPDSAIVGGVRPGVDASTCLDCGAKRIDSQLGLEPTPEEYVANLVEVFREVRRVLRDDGTVWLNLGDSYANPGHYKGNVGDHGTIGRPRQADQETERDRYSKTGDGLKNKDLCGIPWRVAFALQADGWWLRSDIIWSKPNPMPESVTDRPTRAHEYIFLLSKSPRYFYDADAIREPHARTWDESNMGQNNGWATSEKTDGVLGRETDNNAGLFAALPNPAGRNRRSVWEIATQPYSEAHFATFPLKLVEPCILAGSPPKCCGECGAPWERVVEVTRQGLEPGRKGIGLTSERMEGGFPDRELISTATGLHHAPTDRLTKGWCSTCDHDDDSGSPTVLDPFAGAGTTGVVALRHNRSFIGIELNPEYAEMARNRIRDDAPLFNGDEAYSSPVRELATDKQSALGEEQLAMRGGDTKSGFNERWKNRDVS